MRLKIRIFNYPVICSRLKCTNKDRLKVIFLITSNCYKLHLYSGKIKKLTAQELSQFSSGGRFGLCAEIECTFVHIPVLRSSISCHNRCILLEFCLPFFKDMRRTSLKVDILITMFVLKETEVYFRIGIIR